MVSGPHQTVDVSGIFGLTRQIGEVSGLENIAKMSAEFVVVFFC